MPYVRQLKEILSLIRPVEGNRPVVPVFYAILLVRLNSQNRQA